MCGIYSALGKRTEQSQDCLEKIRLPLIIGVQKRDQVSARLGHPPVTSRGYSFVSLIDQSNSFVRQRPNDGFSPVVRSVVDDD